MNFINFKKFCFSKDTIKKMKKQAIKWKNMLFRTFFSEKIPVELGNRIPLTTLQF